MVIQRGTSATLTKDVLYIGSAVPLETSEGLDAVQQPLRSRYPLDSDENVQGILSTLSILPSGIQLQYKNDPSHVVLFPFSALTMCAAVRCVKTVNAATNEVFARFVSLSSPQAGGPNNRQPAIFTAITRRTKGRQVLECHGFVTMSPNDALELVQCTSTLDRRSKHGGLSTLGAEASSSTFDITRGDHSFYTETASLPEFPIQLVPGQPVIQNTSAAFYNEPPSNGYFYSTKNAQAKTYSLHKFNGSTALDDAPSVIATGGDHFDRSGYAGSHYSTSAAMYPTHPRHPILVPVRGYHPQPFARPVIVGPHPHPALVAYPRPRFFSPPPLMRARPVPIFVPPPVSTIYTDDAHLRTKLSRRGSRASSQTSSTTSVSDSPRFVGRHHGKSHHNHTHDDSSEFNSRPRTPPTDYDNARGPRVSRKEDFTLRKNVSHDHTGSSGAVGGKGHNSGYYMVPSYGYYGAPHTLERPRSVPPYVERNGTNTKTKKSKKNKKDRKKSNKKGNHDESTDSAGYTSELAPNGDGKQPRDFRRLENQFKHERAFSKSLAEETRHTVKGNGDTNAYSLNNENVYHSTMY